MPLSNAERQKRWREKQKQQNGKAYMRMERERKRKSYIPVESLAADQLKKRREDVKKAVKQHYHRKRAPGNQKGNSSLASTSQNSTTKKKRRPALVVKLPTKGTAMRTMNRRAVWKAYRNIKTELLQKKQKSLQRRLLLAHSRHEMQSESPSADVSDLTEEDRCRMTPRSRNKVQLQQVDLSPNRDRRIRKRLLLANTVIDSLRVNIKPQKKKPERALDSKVASKVLKKYRCMSSLAMATGLGRKKLSKIGVSRRVETVRNRLQNAVQEFLEREDNSTVLPGKRDTKISDKIPQQKRVLSDYVHNLHGKFVSENPTIKISRSTFSKLRPAHLLLANFASRRTCLCFRHQNLALKLKGLRNAGTECSKNPDVFIKSNETNEALQNTLNGIPDEIDFTTWKKIKDGEKYRWKEVKVTMKKDEFIESMLKEVTAFRAHCRRVQNQYTEMRKLRSTLPENEVVVWMDFAENYICSSVEEVQSAYWNAEMVSLHTMVVYYPPDNERSHQSYVAVSGLLSHNAVAVYTIIEKLLSLIKLDLPSLKAVHYLTDSPTSQYRNKTIFKLLTDHEEEFGVAGRWNYLESGHGKGPCDGLGASVKRAADMAVKQGKVTIQSASDFFALTQASSESTSKVIFFQYTQEDYDASSRRLADKEPLKSVRGTFTIHAVVPDGKDEILTREESCYCPACLADVSTSSCNGWNRHSLVKVSTLQQRENTQNTENSQQKTPEGQDQTSEGQGPFANADDTPALSTTIEVRKEDWVAAVYDEMRYIGQITDTDDDDVQVNFLAKAGKYGDAFKWPSSKDELWITKTDLLKKIETPLAMGKNKRCFKLPFATTEAIENKKNIEPKELQHARMSVQPQSTDKHKTLNIS